MFSLTVWLLLAKTTKVRAAAPLSGRMPLWLQPFNEQFRILGSDGQPLAHVPYHIKDEAGQVYTGFLTSQGIRYESLLKSRKHWKSQQALPHLKSGVRHDRVLL
jgi:hypothetical protein